MDKAPVRIYKKILKDNSARFTMQRNILKKGLKKYGLEIIYPWKR